MANEHITFLHSGDMGDIIAGLASVKEICEREHKKAVLYLDTTGGTTCNDDKLNALILKQNCGLGQKFNRKNYEFIKPLIEVQDYIESVEKWSPDSPPPNINLNRFRYAFVNKTIAQQTNQNLMYCHQVACNLQFGWKGPWLKTITKEFPKKIVIARSCRCQSAHAFYCMHQNVFHEKAYFIGTDIEYQAMQESIRLFPERFPITTCLDAAILMNSSDLIVANSTLFFWVALGLGKQIIHELPIDIPTTAFQSIPGPVPGLSYVIGMHRKNTP